MSAWAPWVGRPVEGPARWTLTTTQGVLQAQVNMSGSCTREESCLRAGWGLGQSLNDYRTIGELVHSRSAMKLGKLKELVTTEVLSDEEEDPTQTTIHIKDSKLALVPFTQSQKEKSSQKAVSPTGNVRSSSGDAAGASSSSQRRSGVSREELEKRKMDREELEGPTAPAKRRRLGGLGLLKPPTAARATGGPAEQAGGVDLEELPEDP